MKWLKFNRFLVEMLYEVEKRFRDEKKKYWSQKNCLKMCSMALVGFFPALYFFLLIIKYFMLFSTIPQQTNATTYIKSYRVCEKCVLEHGRFLRWCSHSKYQRKKSLFFANGKMNQTSIYETLYWIILRSKSLLNIWFHSFLFYLMLFHLIHPK